MARPKEPTPAWGIGRHDVKSDHRFPITSGMFNAAPLSPHAGLPVAVFASLLRLSLHERINLG